LSPLAEHPAHEKRKTQQPKEPRFVDLRGIIDRETSQAVGTARRAPTLTASRLAAAEGITTPAAMEIRRERQQCLGLVAVSYQDAQKEASRSL
jgi:hypothetical protein